MGLDVEKLPELITTKTKLISLTHVSNVLGTINPVKKIVEIAHQNDIPVLVDGAQSVPHIGIDIQNLDADFYAFSAHKIYGPDWYRCSLWKGILVRKNDTISRWWKMISQVTFEKTTYNQLPFKFEASTPIS